MALLTSPVWWVSVVVVGILINLLSSYLKTTLDSRISLISSWWRKRSDEQKAEREEFIEKLRRSEHKQVLASIDDIRARLRAIYLLLLGVFVMLCPAFLNIPYNFSIFILGFGAASLFLSYLAFQSAVNLKILLNRARKEEDQPEGE